MIYIDTDCNVKMARYGSGVIEKLIPEAVDTKSKLLQAPDVMLRGKSKGQRRNRLGTAVCGKHVNGPVLICKGVINEFGEPAWVGMTAEEAGRWIGRLVKIKGSIK